MDSANPPAARACTLAFGPVAIALASDDPAAADWLSEFLGPWFAPTSRSGEVQVTVSSSSDTYTALAADRPLDAPLRPCFAHDQQVIAFPSWRTEDGVMIADLRRSCFLAIARSRIGVFGDPTTRRWRFTLQSVL